MKRPMIGTLAAAACLSVLLAGCTSDPSGPSGSSDSIVIGGTYPLTGEAALIGEYAVTGAELAAEYVAENGGPTFEFNWTDSQLDNQLAVTSTERLAASGIAAILTGGSGVTLAQAPVADRERVSMLNTMGQSPVVRGISDWVFNVIPPADGELTLLAEIAVDELGAKTFGIIAVDNDLGTGDREFFTAALQSHGAEVIIAETFPVGASDMRTALIKIRSVNPDALYIIGNADEAGRVAAQAHELGLEAQLLGRTPSSEPNALDLAGEGANGMVGVATLFLPSEDNPVAQEFVDRYTTKTGNAPSTMAAIAFDAVLILADAYERAGHDASNEELRDAIASTSATLQGAMGPLGINEENIADFPFLAFEIVDGEIVPRR